MAGPAMWSLTGYVQLKPHEVRSFRLPSMAAGSFGIKVTRLDQSLDTGQTNGHDVVHIQKSAGTGGTGTMPPPQIESEPDELLLELFHGDTSVAKGSGQLTHKSTAARDEQWRLRFTLKPTATGDALQHYQIDLDFPSVLPILTRRIPLSYFQQGFDDNWNGRKYLWANVDDDGVHLHIDPEVATYYHVGAPSGNVTFSLPLPAGAKVEHAVIGDIRLSVGSESGAIFGVPEDLPFIQMDFPITSDDGVHPININIPHWFDITLGTSYQNTLRFYLTARGSLSYFTALDSELINALPEKAGPVGIDRKDVRSTARDEVINFFNERAGAVGHALLPWLLGAYYQTISLSYDKTSSQPDKYGLGDIVIQYVGLEQHSSVQENNPGTGTSEALSDEPYLFPQVFYTPRGAGSIEWQPPTTNIAATIPPSTLPQHTDPGDLSHIDHIVVVMMENRSFDMMLGYLSRDSGRTDIDGLKNETGAIRTQFNYYKGNFYYPEHLTSTVITQSPSHSHENVKAQMCDGMAHFVSEYARMWGDDPLTLRNVIGYYGPELATYAMLAREFAVCDRWFCSHVGPTIPNRFVTLTGDLNRDNYGLPEVGTPDYTTFTPSETTNLFDHLSDHGVSWVYFENRVSLMRGFTKYSFDMTNVRPYLDSENGFEATVAGLNTIGPSGGLPQVTFIDPLFGDLPAGTYATMQDNDDAPPSDLQNGQKFISEILYTLFTPTTNAKWQSTMLVIVYDEHGGFYDHVQPPDDAVPLTGQSSGKLGPRVPAFVVSPWTPRGVAINQRLEHASIAATILRRFCSPFPPSMGARIDGAPDLRAAVSLQQPRDLSRLFPSEAQTAQRAMHRATLPIIKPRFRAPRRDDDFHAFLGGLSMTLGSAPTKI